MLMSHSKRKPARRAAQRGLKTVWVWVGLLVVVVAIGAWGAWRLVTAGQPPAAGAEITVAEAAARRDAGAFILDVREPEEWDEYHIPGATLIPLGDLEARLAEVPSDQPIVVVCRSGNRSQQGRDILTTAGYSDVASMAGGLKEWRSQGYPTVTGP